MLSSVKYLKSYIFQEIEREFCFLDDEKYYLVNILSQCTHGQRLDWSFEAPAVLLFTGDTRHRAPENYRVNAHWDLKQEIFADCLWLMIHYSLTSEKSPIKATSTVSRMKYSCCFSLSITRNLVEQSSPSSHIQNWIFYCTCLRHGREQYTRSLNIFGR